MNITQNERDLQRIKDFRLMDDDFMTVVFDKDLDTTGFVVKTILKNDDIKLQSVEVQSEQKNLYGRSVKLDILASDHNGRFFNVEIQRSDRGAGKTRARYHSSILDSNLLKSGDKDYYLPETYVVFITEHDVMHKGLPMYHIERVIQETGELFDDLEHIIYVNGSYIGDDPIGRLMHDFRTSNPEEMFSDVLRRKTSYFKETEEGQTAMCRMMEEMRNEAATVAAEKKTVENYYALRTLDVPDSVLKERLGITDDVLSKYPDLKPRQ